MKKYLYGIRSAAIILISAGYGWAGGHYIPANSPIIAYSFQFIIITILLILGIRFLSLSENEKHKRNWSITGLTIFSSLSLLINVLNIVHGAYNSDKASYGSHNTFADLVPISIIIIGTVLWLITLIYALTGPDQPHSLKLHWKVQPRPPYPEDGSRSRGRHKMGR
jgi:hypothetical protein